MKLISLSFYQLSMALKSVHLWNKADVDRLHDIWLLGSPTPDSRLLDIKHYDPRKIQAGNVEKRLILPNKLAEWVQDVSNRRGFSIDPEVAYEAVRILQRIF